MRCKIGPSQDARDALRVICQLVVDAFADAFPGMVLQCGVMSRNQLLLDKEDMSFQFVNSVRGKQEIMFVS